MSGQFISLVGCAGEVYQRIMVICEAWNVPGNAAVDVLRVTIVFEVFVVRVYRDGVPGAQEKMAPVLEAAY